MAIEIKGDAELKRKLMKLARQFPKATKAALIEAGGDILEDALRRTPVDTGALRDSAYMAVKGSETNPKVELGYTDSKAVAAHERTDVRYRTGEAKFLQNALDAAAPGFTKKLAERISANATRSGEPSAVQPKVRGGGKRARMRRAGRRR